MPIASSDVPKVLGAFAVGGILGALVGRRRKPRRVLEGALIGSGLVGAAALAAVYVASNLGAAAGTAVGGAQQASGTTLSPTQAVLAAAAFVPVVASKKLPNGAAA
jgi:hypothetical protein